MFFPVVPLENPPNASPPAGLLLFELETGAPHISCELKKSMLFCVLGAEEAGLDADVKLFALAGVEKKSFDRP